jgi:preprotein translocase subunit SecD
MAHLILLSALSAAGMSSANTKVVDQPSGMVSAFNSAQAQINVVGECADLHPTRGFEEELQKRETAYLNAVREAKGIWGNAVEPDYGVNTTRPANCSKRNVKIALNKTDKALAAQQELFEQAIANMGHGVWVGPLKLCQGVVKRVQFGNSAIGNQPILEIELDRTAWPVLAEITGRTVGSELAVRMNGQIIMRPRVNEPLESGQLAFTGPDLATLRATQHELTKVC